MGGREGGREGERERERGREGGRAMGLLSVLLICTHMRCSCWLVISRRERKWEGGRG